MSVATVPVYSGINDFEVDVTATADADTGDLTVTHSLGDLRDEAPPRVTLSPLTAGFVGPAAHPFYLSAWTWAGTVDGASGNRITVRKNNTAAGSGAAAAQMRVRIERRTPQSGG